MKIKYPHHWKPPTNWQKITTIDVHTEGEPLRVILEGFPEIKGETVLERRAYAKDNYDSLRTGLMWEPRGHADMYGCILMLPTSPEADFGVLFLHNEGFSTMCGHGIIGVTKTVLETGLFPVEYPVTTLKIETPAGLVTAFARIQESQVASVYFHNVPSFVVALDQKIDVPGFGELRFDMAFGGAFYAYLNVEDVGLDCTEKHYSRLIDSGKRIKKEIMEQYPIIHPFDAELSFLYGVIFIGPPKEKSSHSRNVCVFADGEVDRCPTGTGVSGRMAIHFAREEVGLDQPLVIESIIGSKFTCRVIQSTRFGPYRAVIPEVEGSAFITGKNEFYINPDDPLRHGFMLR
jgi:proline racemase